jgi:WD40 repeat protein
MTFPHFAAILLLLAVAAGCDIKIEVNQPKGGGGGERKVEPLFSIEPGLKDAWGNKPEGPTDMLVSPDGKYLLTLTMTDTENVQVWDLAARKKLHGLRNDIGTMHAHIAIAADSKTAAFVQLRPAGGIVILDLPSGKPRRTIPDERGEIINSFSPHPSLQFAPDGRTIVYGGKKLAAWDVETGAVRFSLAGPVKCVTPFFADGTRFATLSDNEIQVRDATKGTVVKSFGSGGCQLIALARDRKSLIAVDYRKTRLFDLPGGEKRKEFDSYIGTYMHVVLLADGRSVAWLTNTGIIIHDLEAGTKKQEFETNKPYVSALALTPDGSTLLTAASDGMIRGWKVGPKGQVE